MAEDTFGLQANIGASTWVHIFLVGTKVISTSRGDLSTEQYEAYTQATELIRVYGYASLSEAQALLKKVGFDVLVL